MLELTTYTELEIAHRLMTAYAQKCRSLHGHRYEVEITVTAQKLNEDGMIVDFKKLKEVVKTVLDDKWDHGSCFNANDPLAEAVCTSGSVRAHIINGNPTLEWMVEAWALDLQEALDDECPGVVVSMLKASETARNTVTWRPVCLPWERSESVNDTPKTKHAEKEDARNVAVPDVCAFSADGQEDNPDASLYLVQFRTEKMPYSTTVRTSLTGCALVDRCTKAAREFAESFMEYAPGETTVVLLGITKLPG